jgi:hypothetical protein
MAISTGRSSDQFPLRLPDGMRDRIAKEAKANGRSMNAEIVGRLEWSFRTPAGVQNAFLESKDYEEIIHSLVKVQATLTWINDNPEVKALVEKFEAEKPD